jgi:hypothetical protein
MPRCLCGRWGPCHCGDPAGWAQSTAGMGHNHNQETAGGLGLGSGVERLGLGLRRVLAGRGGELYLGTPLTPLKAVGVHVTAANQLAGPSQLQVT